MGDRYTITATPDQLKDRFNVEIPEAYTPRYNAAPSQILPIIIQNSKGVSFFYWGQMPEWAKNKTISNKLIFAEQETLTRKALSKQALMTRRCIIPADGYYDWKQVSKKGKIPYRFVFNEKLVSFAGIWEEFENEKGEPVHTFKIITTSANSTVQSVNDRMPVILDEEKESIWLKDTSSEEELMELLNVYPSEKMGSYTVSPKITDPHVDDESLIEPMAPADQFGNYSLFD